MQASCSTGIEKAPPPVYPLAQQVQDIRQRGQRHFVWDQGDSCNSARDSFAKLVNELYVPPQQYTRCMSSSTAFSRRCGLVRAKRRRLRRESPRGSAHERQGDDDFSPIDCPPQLFSVRALKRKLSNQQRHSPAASATSSSTSSSATPSSAASTNTPSVTSTRSGEILLPSITHSLVTATSSTEPLSTEFAQKARAICQKVVGKTSATSSNVDRKCLLRSAKAKASTLKLTEGLLLDAMKSTNNSQFTELCRVLGLSCWSEDLMLSLTKILFNNNLNSDKARTYLQVGYLGTLRRLKRPASRSSMNALTIACKAQPLSVVHALVLPLLLHGGDTGQQHPEITSPHAELVVRLAKLLADFSIVELLNHLLGVDDTASDNTSTKGRMLAPCVPAFVLLKGVLACPNLNLSNALISKLIRWFNLASGLEKFQKTLQLSGAMHTFIMKHQNTLRGVPQMVASLEVAVTRMKTFVAKSSLSALKRLRAS